MDTRHAADHARLEAARDAWAAARKPRTRDGGRKGQLARTLGLRIDAHMQVFHKTRPFPPPPNTKTFDQALGAHGALH